MTDVEGKLVIGCSGWNTLILPNSETAKEEFFIQVYLQKDYNTILNTHTVEMDSTFYHVFYSKMTKSPFIAMIKCPREISLLCEGA